LTEGRRHSLQQIIRERRDQFFVGRDEYVGLFAQHIILPPDDDRRNFIFNVFGQAGVGKTSLLYRFRQIADRAQSISAWVTETERDPVEVMGAIADQLGHQGHEMKAFNERLKVYRQRRQELESDPEAPHGIATSIGRSLGIAGFRLARQVPVAGALVDFVDEETIASPMGEFASYLARRLNNKDEVSLLLDPIRILTKLFSSDLYSVGENLPIVLAFDGYEQMSEYLDQWLRDTLEGRFGDLPANLFLVISGQEPLRSGDWAPFERIISRMPLEPFSDLELRLYLEQIGITDAEQIEEIAEVSGNLPLLVAVVTTELSGSLAGDAGGTAVDRFLKNVRDPAEREFAINAALPRLLNRDVVRALSAGDQETDLFDRLRQRPFLRSHAEGWTYHDLVRSNLLRYLLRESPKEWARLQGELAAYFEELAKFPAARESNHRPMQAIAHRLESTYHRLCQSPTTALPSALNGFLLFAAKSYSLARTWADAISQAGMDSQSPLLTSWGNILTDGLRAQLDNHPETAAEMYTALLDRADLQPRAQAAARSRRGFLHQQAGNYQQAIDDLKQAQTLLGDDERESIHIATHVAACYTALDDFESALDILNGIISKRPDTQALINRGITYLMMEDPGHALIDLNQATEQSPHSSIPFYWRGRANLILEDYASAAADLSQVISHSSEPDGALFYRARAYRHLGYFDRSLQDLAALQQTDVVNAHAIFTELGHVHLQREDYEQAAAAFVAALGAASDCSDCWNSLATSYSHYLPLAKVPVALRNAVPESPESLQSLEFRAAAFLKLGFADEAENDLCRAIELDPDNIYARALRSQIRGDKLDYQGAVEDISVYIAAEPSDASALRIRSRLLEQCGRMSEAIADVDAVLSRGISDANEFAYHGLLNLLIGENANALVDLNKSLELDASQNPALCCRSITFDRIGESELSRKDIEHALEIAEGKIQKNPNDVANALNIALYYALMSRIDDAKRTYQQLFERIGDTRALRAGAWDLERLVMLYPNNGEFGSLLVMVSDFLMAKGVKVTAEKGKEGEISDSRAVLESDRQFH
jgi:tetratricopeptide (TPR) repeat protein